MKDQVKNKNEKVRVPEMVQNPLGGEPIQVNYCKSPTCANYGVPARTIPVKSGPSEDRDDCYKVVSTAGGGSPALLCKLCGEKPIIKSNEGVAEEITRLTTYLLVGKGCPEKNCSNHDKGIFEYSNNYRKYGYTAAGTQRLRCKLCRTIFTSGKKAKFEYPEKTLSIFMDIVNKAPIRRSMEKAGLNYDQARSYYLRHDYIRKKCLEFSAAFDKHLMTGNVDLGNLIVSSDHQEYTVNWSSASDRRNTIIRAISSVDNSSGFIFGLQSAYDPNVDAESVNFAMMERGDYKIPEAFRLNARLWMFGDDLNRNRGGGIKSNITTRTSLIEKIEQEYQNSIERKDSEDDEEKCKEPRYGMLVHYPYTTYANFFILEKLLKGATHVQHCLDHESVLRAACLTAFENRIRKGTSHAFYVSVNKNYTVAERRAIKKIADAAFRKEYTQQLKQEVPIADCIRTKILSNIRQTSRIGPWKDQWVRHPLPRMDEPEKAMCWLTGRGSSISDRTIDMFLSTSMNGCDNNFQLVRRRINLLERPLLTSSSQRSSYHGYAPYNPAMVQKSLDIFRCYVNFCAVRSTDSQTPAMRLGLATRPYTVKEVLNISPEEKNLFFKIG